MCKLTRLFIKISALFLITHVVLAENVVESANFPVYQNGKLIIPRVDTPGQAGTFQNATFQFDEIINAWRLLDFKTVPIIALNLDKITVTDSFPVQVFLHVSDASFICGRRTGQINQRLVGNKFEITINVENTYTGDPLALCAPYQEIIPLPVYGLDAGNYEYSVNGGDMGSFNLTADNRLK